MCLHHPFFSSLYLSFPLLYFDLCLQRCSSDVFVEQLWVPALKSGQVDQVVHCMKEIDPLMGVWQPHLTAACRIFSRKSLFSVLLMTQIIMNVSLQ